jgi:hypothetical protein
VPLPQFKKKTGSWFSPVVIEVQREAFELFYVVRTTRLDRIERLTGLLGPRAGIRSNLWSLGRSSG